MRKTIRLETAKELSAVAEEFEVELPISERIYLNEFDVSESEGCPFHLIDTSNRHNDHDYFKSFDTNELFEWLPSHIEGHYLRLGKSTKDNLSWADYEDFSKNFLAHIDEMFKSPQEALAKLTIYLIKNGYLK